MGAAFEPGETGLVVLVPDVEPVVGPWRQRLEPSTQLGVPSHITVLYPFLRADELDDRVLAELGRLFAAVDPFDLELPRFGRFPEGVLFLAPEPSAQCRLLTELVAARWPARPPYGGAYADTVPHLTVAVGADPADEALVEASLAPLLPLRARVEAVDLMAFDGSAWADHTRFPLGTPDPAD